MARIPSVPGLSYRPLQPMPTARNAAERTPGRPAGAELARVHFIVSIGTTGMHSTPLVHRLLAGRALMLVVLASALAVGVAPRTAVAVRAARRTQISAGSDRAPDGRIPAANRRRSSGSEAVAARASACRDDASGNGPMPLTAGVTMPPALGGDHGALAAAPDDGRPVVPGAGAAAIRAPPLG